VDKNLHPSAPVAHNKLARVGILTALKQGTLLSLWFRGARRHRCEILNLGGTPPLICMQNTALHFIFKCRRRVLRFSRASAFNSFKNHVIICMNVFLSKLASDVEELLKELVIAHNS
jgi:hypothetical protein